MSKIKAALAVGHGILRTPFSQLQLAKKMPKVYRAYNQARDELEELGLLSDGVYLDEIELEVTFLASLGEAGYVYDTDAGWLRGFGFREGTIYLPSDLPNKSRKEGRTLTDTIRHEFGHAWYWLHPEFFSRPWFEEAFGLPYEASEPTPGDLFEEAIASQLESCKSEREADALYEKEFRNAFATEYASTLACEDFCETFMLLLRYRKSLDRFSSRPELYRKILIVKEAIESASGAL